MGTLNSNVTYIYERADGVTYAREFGKTERKVIGVDYPLTMTARDWNDILKEADTNPALQKAINHVIIIYKISKNYEQ